jgi:energy-coupling factor transporter ATP-binding protein EcfA2
VIVLEGVSYRYPAAPGWALWDVSLEARAGEVVGVRGANETGKTTLCLVASGLAPAAVGGELRGRVLLDGRPTASLRPHELALRCGVLREEVAFGPCNLGLPAADVHERVDEALAVLGLGHLADRDPRHLSGGEAQLVALAGLLALRPPNLALDEPTSRLDPERASLVGDAVARVAAGGAAVLIAEHDEALLKRLCARVVSL